MNPQAATSDLPLEEALPLSTENLDSSEPREQSHVAAATTTTTNNNNKEANESSPASPAPENVDSPKEETIVSAAEDNAASSPHPQDTAGLQEPEQAPTYRRHNDAEKAPLQESPPQPLAKSLRVVGIVPPAPAPAPALEDTMVVYIHGLRLVVRDIVDVDEIESARKKPAICWDRDTANITEFPPDLQQDDDLVVEYSANGRTPCCYHRFVLTFHALVTRGLQATAAVAVAYPRICLIVLSAISVGLCAAGFFTNFVIETETSELWPPKSSRSVLDGKWLWRESRFSLTPAVMDVLIHKNGDNVLGHQGVQRVFEVVDYFSSQDGYKEGCALAQRMSHVWWVGQCRTYGVTKFWNESTLEFQDNEDTDDLAIIKQLSATTYPNGVIVDVPDVMGNTVRDHATGMLVSADSYLIRFDIPWSNVTRQFEAEAVDRMHALRDAWAEDPGNEWRIEFRSWSSYSEEFMRAIMADLWLIPLAAVIVSVFTVIFAFGKCHPVYSRGLLGIGAVLTIVASLMTTFGILFLFGT
jgi:hypothetical protein